MKKLIHVFIVSILCATIFHTASYGKVTVQLQDLLGTITYGFNGSIFSGELYAAIKGINGGDASMNLLNSDGEVVFSKAHKCVQGYTYGNTPMCNLEPLESEAGNTFEISDGKYTLQIFVDDKEIYSIDFSIVINQDWGSVCVDGDWKNMAILDLNAFPSVAAIFFLGGPEYMNSESANLQAQIYKDGQYYMRAHMEGAYYYGCSVSSVQLIMFNEDEDHFSSWIYKDAILSEDGEYELRLYVDRKIFSTYKFSVKDGAFMRSLPKSFSAGLAPNQIHGYYDDSFWLYADGVEPVFFDD